MTPCIAFPGHAGRVSVPWPRRPPVAAPSAGAPLVRMVDCCRWATNPHHPDAEADRVRAARMVASTVWGRWARSA